jgi:dTDP-4-dehydrorhamnose reductase
MNMKKKLFILGIGGLTGSKLALTAIDDFEIYGSYNLRNPKFDFAECIQLDVLDVDKLKKVISDIHPDILINASAINNVDYCETHHDEAKKINIDSVEQLYKISNSLGIKLIHLSSDSVFDGTKLSPYVEDDIPNPINYYGYTKLMGEKLTLGNSNNLVVRTTVLYGWLVKSLLNLPSSSMKTENFVQWLINKLKSNESVKIITDEISSPIIVDDFAKSILHLIKNDHVGIFHSAPKIQITRYDFCVKLANFLDLNEKLIEVTTNKKLGRKVSTGFNKCLNSSKMTDLTNFKFLSLEESFGLLRKQISS